MKSLQNPLITNQDALIAAVRVEKSELHRKSPCAAVKKYELHWKAEKLHEIPTHPHLVPKLQMRKPLPIAELCGSFDPIPVKNVKIQNSNYLVAISPGFKGRSRKLTHRDIVHLVFQKTNSKLRPK